MYAISFHLYHSSATRLATDIYELMAATYKLSSIKTLLASLDEDVSWSDCDPDTQVFYLESLRKPIKNHLFQIQFKTSPKAAEYTTLNMHIEQESQLVYDLMSRFPPRGDRYCSANLLAWLKEQNKENGIVPEFELAGFGERQGLRFIREHSLSAFRWAEPVSRYLHVTDDLNEVQEVKRGLPFQDKRPGRRY